MKVLARAINLIHRAYWRIVKPTTVGVRVILVKDEEVVLVKHTYHEQWYLPGGGVRKNETLEQAARREAAEELGAQLDTLRLFGVYSNFFEHKSDHVVVFSCRNFTLSRSSNSEIETFRFVPLDNLPAGLSPGSKRRIQEYVHDCPWPVCGTW